MASLNLLELRSMRVDNCERARTERERLSRGKLGFWLDEYTD
jgi:hypothetical protein